MRRDQRGDVGAAARARSDHAVRAHEHRADATLAEPGGERGVAGDVDRARDVVDRDHRVAAKKLFVQPGATHASIQDITDAADVGFGSFYNHFTSKAELFDAAIAQTFEEHGTWLDALLADEPDPAVVFAMSMRLTGRQHKTRPEMAQVLMRASSDLLASNVGVGPRALRDIKAAVRARRFTVVALACAGGALVGVLHLLAANPRARVEQKTDEMVRNVLRMFGVPDAEARAIVSRPLPRAARDR